MNIVKGIVFGVGSVVIIWYSWPSLRRPRSHGFPRFFAFLAIMGLLLLNLKYWFLDPFSPAQLLSWLLLMVSLFLVMQGFYLLWHGGRPEGNIEVTTRLVRVGTYRYIRHPLYGSLFYLAWGICLKNFSLLAIGLAIVATVALVATAKLEEKENLQRFGEEYAAYMQVTKMFVPYLF